MAKNAKSSLVPVFFLCLAMVAGCDQIQSFFQPGPKVTSAFSQEASSPQVQGTVLAKVNNNVITLENFDEKLKVLEALAATKKTPTADEKKMFLDELIKQDLIFQEAKARGIDKKKEVRDAIDEFKKSAMIQQLVNDEIKGIVVEPSEIESAYNQNKGALASDVEIKAREIVVPTEATAKEILISLLQGGDFAAIAKERSIAPSGASGGDVGIVKKGAKFDKFYEVVLGLEQGQNSQYFKGPDGYYIVKVDEKKGGTIPRLDEVYDKIKNFLLEQKQRSRLEELSNKLKRDAKIEIKEDLLR